MSDSTESRLTRLEELFLSGGEMMLKAVEVAQQNAELIKQNSQQIQQNSQQISRLETTTTRLEGAMAQLALQAATDRAEFEEFRRTTRAALEKIDRVLDYLMQRDDN